MIVNFSRVFVLAALVSLLVPAAFSAAQDQVVEDGAAEALSPVDPGAAVPALDPQADSDPAPAPPAEIPVEHAAELGKDLAAAVGDPEQTGIHPNDMASVVFTHWEHTALKDARRARGLARPPTEEELARDLKTPPEDLSVRPPPEERDISLGGIVYVNSSDWTIWLNGKRVTPKALPEEAIDLKVYNEYIEVKWFDKYTNQIFPIRLRAHQRFNIDTRIFLPG